MNGAKLLLQEVPLASVDDSLLLGGFLHGAVNALQLLVLRDGLEMHIKTATLIPAWIMIVATRHIPHPS